MLKRFEVRNYKNFQDSLIVDFSKIGGYHFNQDCLTNGLLSKMIIYGKNATGKTNLGWAIMDIFSQFIGVRRILSPFLNVDSNENSALFKYEFVFDGQIVKYEYRKQTEKVLLEELFEIDGHLIFKINYEKKNYDISGLKNINAETLVFDRYKEMIEDLYKEDTLPFIRWIVSNTALSSNSILMQLYNFVKSMNFTGQESHFLSVQNAFAKSFINKLEEKDQLNDFTEFLNFMGVKCKLTIIESPDGSKNLYFDNSKPIPFFENASSGTKSLYKLYQKISMATNSSKFIYMDEFDAFYHYEMSNNVMRYLIKKYPECQIILTTHNTNLMTNRLMRPDCLFILSQTGELTALCNATQRELREGHNLEKMYLSGEFEQYE